MGAIVAIVVIAAAASGGGGSSSQSTSKPSSNTSKPAGNSAASGCGTTAAPDCTPHVGPNGTVQVDTLRWRVLGAQKASTIGDQSIGLGAKANGTFVIVNLSVTNGKNESVTLTDNVVKLQSGKREYDADSSGTTAAIGAGKKPLLFETLGPGVTLNSKVVFDVPPAVLDSPVAVRFGELGFGDTKAYIALPTPTAA